VTAEFSSTKNPLCTLDAQMKYSLVTATSKIKSFGSFAEVSRLPDTKQCPYVERIYGVERYVSLAQFTSPKLKRRGIIFDFLHSKPCEVRKIRHCLLGRDPQMPGGRELHPVCPISFPCIAKNWQPNKALSVCAENPGGAQKRTPWVLYMFQTMMKHQEIVFLAWEVLEIGLPNPDPVLVSDFLVEKRVDTGKVCESEVGHPVKEFPSSAADIKYSCVVRQAQFGDRKQGTVFQVPRKKSSQETSAVKVRSVALCPGKSLYKFLCAAVDSRKTVVIR